MLKPFIPALLSVFAASPHAWSDAPDPEIMKAGQQQFILCGACHGQSGEGGAAGPPLAGSEWVNGPAENLIRIQLRGLVGPITVKGVEYNMPGGMVAMAYQSDEQIASVLTYVRNSFGNSAPPVTPEDVAAFREEVGQPQLIAAELIPPVPAATGGSGGTPPKDHNPKYDKLRTGLGLPGWIASLLAIFVAACILPAFIRR